MSIDGTYAFVYCGVTGVGVGVFTLFEGVLRGSDASGGRYTGSAVEQSDGRVGMAIEIEIGAGTFLVQGSAPQDIPHRRKVEHMAPPLFGDGAPITVSVSPSSITLMIRRVSDEWAPAASNGFELKIKG